jgi:hypothetical protein
MACEGGDCLLLPPQVEWGSEESPPQAAVQEVCTSYAGDTVLAALEAPGGSVAQRLYNLGPARVLVILS